MPSIIQEIKLRLSIATLFERDGHELKRSGSRLICRCPWHSERTASCVVYVSQGTFNCFGCGAHGDQLDYVQLRDRCDFGTALRRLAQAVGVQLHHPEFSSNRRAVAFTHAAPARSPKRDTLPPDPMPPAVAVDWKRMVDSLRQDKKARETLASARGWPLELVGKLVTDRLVGFDTNTGGFAFPVDYPTLDKTGAFSLRQIGYHLRLPRRRDNDRVKWFFVPNERLHGNSIPAVPFLIGNFTAASLLVISEGQWDILSFAFAAGWLAHNDPWPDSVCGLGIRGVQGIGPFLAHYRDMWPAGVRCLLLPDNDEAGAAWFDTRGGRPSFAERLGELCAEVIVEDLPGAKDFNEAWAKGLVSCDQVEMMLADGGLMDKRGSKPVANNIVRGFRRRMRLEGKTRSIPVLSTTGGWP